MAYREEPDPVVKQEVSGLNMHHRPRYIRYASSRKLGHPDATASGRECLAITCRVAVNNSTSRVVVCFDVTVGVIYGSSEWSGGILDEGTPEKQI
jgi:hypothetical protein